MNELTTVNTDLRVLKKPTKKQKMFITGWLDPNSDTYGNAFQSARAAGYSEYASRIITGNKNGLLWVQEAKELFAAGLDEAHVMLGLQNEAINAKASRDRIMAYKTIGEFKGMKIDKTEHQINVTFTNSVPRPGMVITPTHDEPKQGLGEPKLD